MVEKPKDEIRRHHSLQLDKVLNQFHARNRWPASEYAEFVCSPEGYWSQSDMK